MRGQKGLVEIPVLFILHYYKAARNQMRNFLHSPLFVRLAPLSRPQITENTQIAYLSAPMHHATEIQAHYPNVSAKRNASSPRSSKNGWIVAHCARMSSNLYPIVDSVERIPSSLDNP